MGASYGGSGSAGGSSAADALIQIRSAWCQLSGLQTVIEIAKHRLTVGAEGIGYRSAMAAGTKDQPTMARGLGIAHQLWDATPNGTATR